MILQAIRPNLVTQVHQYKNQKSQSQNQNQMNNYKVAFGSKLPQTNGYLHAALVGTIMLGVLVGEFMFADFVNGDKAIKAQKSQLNQLVPASQAKKIEQQVIKDEKGPFIFRKMRIAGRLERECTKIKNEIIRRYAPQYKKSFRIRK